MITIPDPILCHRFQSLVSWWRRPRRSSLRSGRCSSSRRSDSPTSASSSARRSRRCSDLSRVDRRREPTWVSSGRIWTRSPYVTRRQCSPGRSRASSPPCSRPWRPHHRRRAIPMVSRGTGWRKRRWVGLDEREDRTGAVGGSVGKDRGPIW